LISGHLDEGMATMRSVLDALHLRFPATPGRALVSMLWHRARARLRRYRFDWREAHTIAAVDLQRVDICESVSKGLMLTDMIRAADYQARTLVAALEVGEPGRISEALSLDADNLAGVARFPSTRAHVRTMLARATELAL